MLSVFVKNQLIRKKTQLIRKKRIFIICFYILLAGHGYEKHKLLCSFLSYPQQKSHYIPIIVDNYVEKVENISTFYFHISLVVSFISVRRRK